MKAISIKQPWATMIMLSGKDVENRDWHTNYKGTIAIHASKDVSITEYQQARLKETRITGKPSLTPSQCPVGVIIGVVDIVGCLRNSSSPWFVGKYGFLLENPIMLPNPIPCKGALSFWEIHRDVEANIQEQLKGIYGKSNLQGNL